MRSYSPQDFSDDVSTNTHIILLNFKFWLLNDYAAYGIHRDRKQETLKLILERWKMAGGNHPYFPCDPVGAALLETP